MEGATHPIIIHPQHLFGFRVLHFRVVAGLFVSVVESWFGRDQAGLKAGLSLDQVG